MIIKKGTTAECLNDFFHCACKPKLLMDFAQVSPKTLKRWRNTGILPLGETHLRLRYFLHFCGYEVSELSLLSPLLFEVGESIALGNCKLDEVARMLKMANHDQLLIYLRGEVQPIQWRMDLLAEFARETRKTLDEKREQARNVIIAAITPNMGVSAVNCSISADTAKLIARFEAACKAALTLAEQFKTGPPELRIEMRRRMASGSEPLLHLTWEALNQLLYERKKT